MCGKKGLMKTIGTLLLLTVFLLGNTVWAESSRTDPAAGTTQTEEASHDTEYYLPVFETSDTHGYLADAADNEIVYLLAYISDKVQDARNGDLSRAVLLDGGDIYQGNTIPDIWLSKVLPFSVSEYSSAVSNSS